MTEDSSALFPRGGTISKPAQTDHQDADNLFQKEMKKSKKKRRSQDAKSEDKDAAPTLLEYSAKKPELLSTELLQNGFLVLGCVSQVEDVQLTVSLPNRLEGFVPIKNTCEAYTSMLETLVKTSRSKSGTDKGSEDEDSEDEKEFTLLSDLFSVGAVVRCSVVSCVWKEGHNKPTIELTMDPKIVNANIKPSTIQKNMVLSGFVASVEDHGYVVDIGVKSVNAFLDNKQAEKLIEHSSQGEALQVGQYLNCKVTSKPTDNFVKLSVAANKVFTDKQIAENQPSLHALVPGMRVPCTVQECTNDGLVVKVFESYSGTIHLTHLPNFPKDYSIDDNFSAVLLFINFSRQVLALTLLPHLMTPDISGQEVTLFEGVNIRDILDDCTVMNSNKKSVYFDVHGKYKAYAGLRNVSDNMKLENAAFVCPPKSKHRCRVMAFCHMDRLLIVTLKESILKQRLDVNEVKPGQIVRCTVKSFKANNIFVDVKGVRGFIPASHNADVKLENPDIKYSIGKKLKCRVLHLGGDGERLLLTNKETLVQSPHPLITNLDDVEIGSMSHGCVCGVKDNGVRVRFYNNITGFIPLKQLPNELGADVHKAYSEGQVVCVRVINCVPEQNKLILSTKTNQFETIELPEGYSIGKVVSATVTRVDKQGLAVSCEPGDHSGFIMIGHLSDNAELARICHHLAREGDTLSQCVCIGAHTSIHLSMKASLLDAAINRNFVTKKTDLQEGFVYPGYVTKVLPSRLLVGYGRGVTATVFYKSIFDDFVPQPTSYFSHNQSVITYIGFGEEDGRPCASLKPSLCFPGGKEKQHSVDMLHLYLAHYYKLRQQHQDTAQDTDSHNIAKLKIGGIVSATIDSVDEDMLTLSYNGVTGFTHITNTDMEYTVGATLKAVVLHIDIVHNKVHFSVCQNLIRNLKLGKKNKQPMTVGAVKDSQVLFLTENFVMLELFYSKSGGSRLAYAPAKMHMNDIVELRKLTVGQQLPAVIRHADSQCIITDALQSGKLLRAKRPTAVVEVGEVYEGKITNIHPRHGLKVQLQGNVIGEVAITDISDTYTDQPTTMYHVGQEVQCVVLAPAAHNDGRTWICSMRQSRLKPDDTEHHVKDKEIRSIGDIAEGVIVRGFVVNAGKGGLFISICRNVDGRVQYTNIVPDRIRQAKTLFPIGKLVTTKIIKINHSARTVELSMLESDTGVNPGIPADRIIKRFGIGTEELKMENGTVTKPSLPKKRKHEQTTVEDAMAAVKKNKIETPLKELSSEITWSDSLKMQPNDAEDDNSSDEETMAEKLDKEQKSLELRKITELEKLVSTSPDSSIVWLKLVAYHVENGNVDMARAVIERALKTIGYREEQEKFNIWVAYMNLENLYGTDDTLKSVVDRAMQMNEPLKVYTQLANIYMESKKYQEAESLYHDACKRLSQKVDLWVGFGLCYFIRGEIKQARDVMARALKSLDTDRHLKLMNRFAQMEFKYGDKNTAETMFSKILDSHKKRLDIWMVFIDLMIKHGDIARVRPLFEQLLSTRPKRTAMKSVFKKYLEFEIKFGNEKSIEACKQKIAEYGNSHVS